jgi:hypothetical protein
MRLSALFKKNMDDSVLELLSALNRAVKEVRRPGPGSCNNWLNLYMHSFSGSFASRRFRQWTKRTRERSLCACSWTRFCATGPRWPPHAPGVGHAHLSSSPLADCRKSTGRSSSTGATCGYFSGRRRRRRSTGCAPCTLTSAAAGPGCAWRSTNPRWRATSASFSPTRLVRRVFFPFSAFAAHVFFL